MTEIMSLDRIHQLSRELGEHILAVQQPRSNIALSQFVVGQHATPERRFCQCLEELAIKIDNIELALIDLEGIALKRSQLTDSPEDALERRRLKVQEGALRRALLGATREAEWLYRYYQQNPKFTYEQIQAAEPDYWLRRGMAQAELDFESRGAISYGNLEMLKQLGIKHEPVDMQVVVDGKIETQQARRYSYTQQPVLTQSED